MLLSLNSCASMFGSNNRAVVITSEPTGASVYYDNVYYGKTPTTVLMPRAEYDDIPLLVQKDGYQDTNIIVTTRFQNVGYWNFIVLPSFLFDFATGCMFEVKPGEYQVNMIPLSESEISYESGMNVNVNKVIESINNEKI